MSGKVAIAGFYHETNTFSTKPTRLQDFEDYQFAVGGDLIARYRGTNTEMGGMIEAAARLHIELVPLLFAAAVPSGTITRDGYEHLCDRLERALDAAEPVDGMLLVLHGAAVAEGAEDADGHLLARLRRRLGDARPLIATTDYHANISRRMFRAADAIIGYDSFPHVDMAERGAEAAGLLSRMLRGDRVAGAYRSVPLVSAPQRQGTADAPLAAVMERLHELEDGDGMSCGTLAMGFPYADTGDIGSSILFYGDEEESVQGAAEILADYLWSRRHELQPDLTPLDALAEQIDGTTSGPLILVDPADNIGGGSAGDGTAVLEEILRQGVEGAVVVINDPEAAARAAAVGVGGAFSGLVGGKTDRAHGDPLSVSGTVTFRGEARFTHSGSYMTGFVTSMGLCAVVAVEASRLVLTSLRTMPFDIEQLRAVGIEPGAQRIIVVKSATAWRAAYGPIAGKIVYLDTPGICSSNLMRLPYRNRRRPLFPFETDTRFPNGAG